MRNVSRTWKRNLASSDFQIRPSSDVLEVNDVSGRFGFAGLSEASGEKETFGEDCFPPRRVSRWLRHAKAEVDDGGEEWGEWNKICFGSVCCSERITPTKESR